MEKIVKNWWILSLMGFLLLIMGIYFFAKPLFSFTFLAMFMAVGFFVTGIFEVAFALSNSKMNGWGWRLTVGILDIIIGSYLIMNPLLSNIFLMFLVGFWVLYYGITLISFSLEAKNMNISDWGLWLALGILAVIFSCILIFSPAASIGFIISFVGISAITMGIMNMYIGYRLRKIEKKLKNL